MLNQDDKASMVPQWYATAPPEIWSKAASDHIKLHLFEEYTLDYIEFPGDFIQWKMFIDTTMENTSIEVKEDNRKVIINLMIMI